MVGVEMRCYQRCSVYKQFEASVLLMLGTLLIVFTIIAFIFALLFLCLCVGGILGILNFAKKCIVKNLSISHDQIYSSEAQPINEECFICLDKIANEVVATCNHSFCGQCITNYIRSNDSPNINCPACRKEILVLFRRFQPVTAQQKSIKEFISSYNYKFTKQPSILRAIAEFANTLRNLPILFTSSGLNYLLGDSRLKYVILFALYAFSPVDLLPEAVLGPIGLLDDGIVVAGMIRQVSSILYGFVREEGRDQ